MKTTLAKEKKQIRYRIGNSSRRETRDYKSVMKKSRSGMGAVPKNHVFLPSIGMSWTGNEHVTRDQVAQREIGGFRDAYADCRNHFGARRAVSGDVEIRGWIGEILFVVADSSDAKGFGQASRAAGEIAQVTRAVDPNAAKFCHFLDAAERLKGAEKNSPGFAVRQTGNIQTEVVAVDEIDVSSAGRTEKDG